MEKFVILTGALTCMGFKKLPLERGSNGEGWDLDWGRGLEGQVDKLPTLPKADAAVQIML